MADFVTNLMDIIQNKPVLGAIYIFTLLAYITLPVVMFYGKSIKDSRLRSVIIFISGFSLVALLVLMLPMMLTDLMN